MHDQIALYQKANGLYELLYVKNDFNYNLDMMCSNCIAISQLFMEAKDIGNALCFLNKGVDYIIAFDSLTDGACYTSLLSDKLSYWGEDFDEALNKHEHRNLSICKILYNEFYEGEIYKSVVEDKQFKDVIDRLK